MLLMDVHAPEGRRITEDKAISKCMHKLLQCQIPHWLHSLKIPQQLHTLHPTVGADTISEWTTGIC